MSIQRSMGSSHAEVLGMVFIFVDGNDYMHPELRALLLNTDGFGVISDRLLYARRGYRCSGGGSAV